MVNIQKIVLKEGFYLLIHEIDQSNKELVYSVWDDKEVIQKKDTTHYLIDENKKQVIFDGYGISLDFFINIILENRNEKFIET